MKIRRSNGNPKINIDYIIDNSSWNGVIKGKKLFFKSVAQKCLNVIYPFPKGTVIHFSMRLAGDILLQKLNHEFMGKNKPTNVLSFPEQDIAKGDFSRFPKSGEIYLGDLAFSYERIHAEAKEQYKNIFNHFVHLFVHGIFHLGGFDHMTKKQAKEMEAMEIEVLALFKINNPYL